MDEAIFQAMAAAEDRHWWFVARRRIVQHTLARLALPAGPAILEAGCGSGGNLPMLAAMGPTCAFEPETSAANVAAARGCAQVLPGSLPHNIPFADRRFELIVMTDVLEHVEHDVEALRALGSRLSDTGRLVLTVPALPALFSHHDTLHHHYRRYTRASLGRAAADAGLQVVKITYFNFFLLPLIASARWASRCMPSPEAKQTMGLTVPVTPVNAMLRGIMSSERWLLSGGGLPLGVSLLMVAQRPAAGHAVMQP